MHQTSRQRVYDTEYGTRISAHATSLSLGVQGTHGGRADARALTAQFAQRVYPSARFPPTTTAPGSAAPFPTLGDDAACYSMPASFRRTTMTLSDGPFSSSGDA